ncbi:hypothetical protein HDU76_004466 [Blyttiomyces sp. JEL0837]|nr:hypothetical protein HDU76_004466 [Blyttiomyces sp. JEL0837]
MTNHSSSEEGSVIVHDHHNKSEDANNNNLYADNGDDDSDDDDILDSTCNEYPAAARDEEEDLRHSYDDAEEQQPPQKQQQQQQSKPAATKPSFFGNFQRKLDTADNSTTSSTKMNIFRSIWSAKSKKGLPNSNNNQEDSMESMDSIPVPPANLAAMEDVIMSTTTTIIVDDDEDGVNVAVAGVVNQENAALLVDATKNNSSSGIVTPANSTGIAFIDGVGDISVPISHGLLHRQQQQRPAISNDPPHAPISSSIIPTPPSSPIPTSTPTTHDDDNTNNIDSSTVSETTTKLLPPPATPISKPTLIPGKWFDRVMIINLENTDFHDAISNPPNYIAQIVGDTIVKDDWRYDISASNVVDLLERKGVSWGAYMEGYPDGLLENEIFLGLELNGYVRRHNPFASMTNIQRNPKRVNRIMASERFFRDLEDGTLPQYIFYTPDQNNNGHDTGVGYAGAYVDHVIKPLLTNPKFMKSNTLMILTFDETMWWVGKNRVATWLLGTAVDDCVPGVVDSTKREDKTKYNHYSILRTVEENWNLGSLKRNDEKATAFKCLKLRLEA